MKTQTNYVSKTPDEHGICHYTDEEHRIWHTLFAQQKDNIQKRACDEYLLGHDILKLPPNHVPQLADVTRALMMATGWSVVNVPALISYDRFFGLLKNRQFPAATFIRSEEELEYLQEPDIFHEIYGHCPLLTHPVYADFMQAYGEIGANAAEKDQPLLARLYWFTVEFGLIQTQAGLRCYGAGLLSSTGETVYALESDKPERKPFDIIEALRTPYRIDIFQPIYFVIDSFQQLYDLVNQDLIGALAKARELGQYAPKYPPKEEA